MSNFKEKSQLFIMGLMAGLLIAGGFFILKLDDYFKELKFYKSVAKTFSHTSKNDETIVNNADTELATEKKVIENKSKNKKELNNEETAPTDFIMNADSLNSNTPKDSLMISSINNESAIVVRKDELLFTKTMDVLNLSPVANRTTSKDSLLLKVGGMNDDKYNSKQFFNIEFWQSPLNYKGYKMSKYKMVLYGITSADVLKIYKLDDVIYLKNGPVVYQLDYASDFKQYEHITDETITNKLK